MLVIGLMSGTSMDGVTAALVDIEEEQKEIPLKPTSRLRVKLLTSETFSFPYEVREELLRLSETGDIHELCDMNFFLGEVFAQAALDIVAKAGRELSEISLIGCHGQTMCHHPRGLKKYNFRRPSTLQIGEIDVIAERTGITTIGDFRPRDIAAGGEGAPLIPYVDHVLFSSPERSRVLLNIGGIANVTYLPAGAGPNEIKAFDTGPGNMVIDRIVQKLSGGKLAYDVSGAMAAKGEINESLLKELMEHPFIKRKPPKSTGREEFGEPFAIWLLEEARERGLGPEDLVATVTAFTVESIVENCRRFLGPFEELIASGGGVRNLTIMRWLAERLPGVKVTTTEEYGIPVQAKEAVGFAILAYQALKKRPNNVPAATGAKEHVVMGKIAWGRKR